MSYERLEDVIQSHLETGETILWAGQPNQGIKLRGQDIFFIPFSLVWGGFAVFWEVMALSICFVAEEGEEVPGAIGIVFPLFGLPFVLIGLYLVFGRFLVDSRRRSRTFYGVTNDRIIIVSGVFSQTVKSLNLRTLSDLSMTEKRDGSGSITFGPTHPLASFFGGTSWPTGAWNTSPSFELVPDVAEVYRIIRDAQKDRVSV